MEQDRSRYTRYISQQRRPYAILSPLYSFRYTGNTARKITCRNYHKHHLHLRRSLQHSLSISHKSNLCGEGPPCFTVGASLGSVTGTFTGFWGKYPVLRYLFLL
ncbi:unnamed protein product [Microthlaspi erraticum]|uniref:Uncharacterized protein n=1 Tax=Microthlaspi erraticum TaxID=1685480 RepID=A0A6D2K7V1_9BRAS|nr:unnamed protein product [Microthlaspi erraticum]